MSGSTASADTNTGPLLDAEKTDVRRFCGYDAYGNGNSGVQSWRFFTAYGVLEFKLNDLSVAELAVLRTYLSQLYPLETGILGAAANLGTQQAAVWTRNANEIRDRTALFDMWRMRLCEFLGVPAGPQFSGANAGRITI